VAQEIFKNGGVKEFYKGIDAALMRQVVYGTLRLGIYFNLIEYFKKQNEGANTSIGQKAFASFTAGCLGSFVGNPMDLSLVRMQADSTLPEAERRNYNGVFDALKRTAAEEGVPALWKGAVATMARASALNMAMLISYDTVREKLTASYPEESPFKIQVASSMLSGVATSCASLPFDNIKTKVQKQKAGPDGVLPYKSIMDCLQKSIAREGVTGLWTGLPTYYFRIAPHAVITLLAAEQYKRILGLSK